MLSCKHGWCWIHLHKSFLKHYLVLLKIMWQMWRDTTLTEVLFSLQIHRQGFPCIIFEDQVIVLLSLTYLVSIAHHWIRTKHNVDSPMLNAREQAQTFVSAFLYHTTFPTLCPHTDKNWLRGFFKKDPIESFEEIAPFCAYKTSLKCNVGKYRERPQIHISQTISNRG